jgi:hypothetical protein
MILVYNSARYASVQAAPVMKRTKIGISDLNYSKLTAVRIRSHALLNPNKDWFWFYIFLI